MSDLGTERMWAEFRPLWTELLKVGTDFQIAGGYGLLLKQQWLNAHTGIPIAVPFEQWKSNIARATKDYDILVGLDLLADKSCQQKIAHALKCTDFVVSEGNERWQFIKKLDAEQFVQVDFQAKNPMGRFPTLATDEQGHVQRVKHKPYLGDRGIHGFVNHEAEASDLHPFQFELDGLSLAVPNPVTWAMMKLAAFHERFMSSKQTEKSGEYRKEQRAIALKHCQDVCRVVAMVTRDENEKIGSVIKSIDQSSPFTAASQTSLSFFESIASPVTSELSRYWSDKGLATIRDSLATWFKSAIADR